MLISPQGTVVIVTSAEVEALFARMWEALRRRQYARSELTDCLVRQVAADLVFVSVSRFGTGPMAQSSSGSARPTRFARAQTAGRSRSPSFTSPAISCDRTERQPGRLLRRSTRAGHRRQAALRATADHRLNPEEAMAPFVTGR
jgi:hypothetical protein